MELSTYHNLKSKKRKVVKFIVPGPDFGSLSLAPVKIVKCKKVNIDIQSPDFKLLTQPQLEKEGKNVKSGVQGSRVVPLSFEVNPRSPCKMVIR